jgi:hypothetical protein
MNMQYPLQTKPLTRWRFFCFAIASPMLLLSCREDRTTVIFGTVLDQSQQPVDSIMVTISGVRSFHSEVIQSTYTDKDGHFELVTDVPRKYVAVNAGIPYFPLENPKYQEHYQIGKVFQNTRQTANCCNAPIGEKTQWDFELIPQ